MLSRVHARAWIPHNFLCRVSVSHSCQTDWFVLLGLPENLVWLNQLEEEHNEANNELPAKALIT